MTALEISSGKAARLARRYQDTVPVDVFGLAAELGLGPRFDPDLAFDNGAYCENCKGSTENAMARALQGKGDDE